MYKLSQIAATDFSSIYEYTLLNFGVRQADAYT
jgi:toxin ParE1/3/4